MRTIFQPTRNQREWIIYPERKTITEARDELSRLNSQGSDGKGVWRFPVFYDMKNAILEDRISLNYSHLYFTGDSKEIREGLYRFEYFQSHQWEGGFRVSWNEGTETHMQWPFLFVRDVQ